VSMLQLFPPEYTKQASVLDGNRTMDDVLKYNICINVPSSQTFRAYPLEYSYECKLYLWF
jgi:hypothetical protein